MTWRSVAWCISKGKRNRSAPQHACEETDAWQAPSAGLAASHSADAETLRMHDWGGGR